MLGDAKGLVAEVEEPAIELFAGREVRMIDFELRDGACGGDFAGEVEVQERLADDDEHARSERERENSERDAWTAPSQHERDARREHGGGRRAFGTGSYERRAREAESERKRQDDGQRLVATALQTVPGDEGTGPNREKERDLHAAEERPRESTHTEQR